MLLHLFTVFHVAISLVAVLSGIVVVHQMLTGRRLGRWNSIFLVTTVITSASGFLFPVSRFLPSHGVGIVSLLVLAIAHFAWYRRRLAGRWRKIYAVMAVLALYLNAFVGVVQAFLKIPALHALAPTQTETPFKIAQAALLTVAAVVATFAALRFRGAQPDSAQGSSNLP